MNRRTLLLLTLALVALVSAAGLTGSSSASFVTSSTNASTVTAAADWTPPTVALLSLGTATRGSVSLEATAADAESGIRSVEFQVRAAGTSEWQRVALRTQAPYAVSWDTTTTGDGGHELRAVATDNAGYTAVSVTRTTTVVNAAGITLDSPGPLLRGSVALGADLTAGSGLDWTVRIERRAQGSTDWQPVLTGLTKPYAGTWDTTSVANGRHDLRAVATAGTTTVVSAVVGAVLVDNLGPVVSLSDPGTPLAGEIMLTTTASDSHSGIASVVVQAASSATGPWTDLCSTTAAAYACRHDTTKLAYGPTFFRARATDRAGNSSTTPVIGPRLVDNTVRSITLADPGAQLAGRVDLAASATSTATIASVRFQRSPAGRNTWTDECTDTAAPWTCAWDTKKVTDGKYDLRAVLTDVNGNQAVSNVVTSREVDNVTTVFKGVDVQTTNAGTTGLVEKGDTLGFTFSRLVDLTTVTPGWDGSNLPVRLEITDPGLLNGGFTDDIVTVTRPGSTVNLGSVRVSANLIGLLHSHATFQATLVATTQTVDGKPRTVVTVTVGDLVSGGVRATNFESTMTWSPSGAVLALSGQALSTAQVTESGAYDKDF